MHMAVGPRLGPVADGELADAYPWPDADTWLRVVMVATLDGAVAGPDGRSRSISSETDRLVLGEIRRLSDAILVGASTVRMEPYGPVVAREDAGRERAALGLSAAPQLVVVSGSLALPWAAPMFTSSSVRPLVVTTEASTDAARAVAREHADLLVLSGEQIDGRELRARLADRGLRRVVCEGGPGLVASLAASGAIDEVDLALSPCLAGGSRPPGGSPLADRSAFGLHHVLSDGGFLFTRYLALRGDDHAQEAS